MAVDVKLSLETAARRFSQYGMHAEACEALAKRAAFSPGNPLIWNDLGVEYIAAGQREEALTSFKQAYAAMPEYPVSLYNLGKLTLERCLDVSTEEQQKDNHEVRQLALEAERYLRASVAEDPSMACAHELLFTVSEVLGDRRKARFHLLEALKLAPELQAVYTRSWIDRLPLLKRFSIRKGYEGPSFLHSR